MPSSPIVIIVNTRQGVVGLNAALFSEVACRRSSLEVLGRARKGLSTEASQQGGA
jgi:hypothetical protein